MTRRFTCRVLGHRWEFSAAGETVHRRCGRGCDAKGTRSYGTSEEARKFAYLLDPATPGPPVGLLAALGGAFTAGDRSGRRRRSSHRRP